MQKSAIYKMRNEKVTGASATFGQQPIVVQVSVRSGSAASPFIDVAALKNTTAILTSTLEELDGACG